MDGSLHDGVRERFGVLPNFFRLASSDPSITRNLWGFAQFAYLDNPMPSLFKERLFVYLSRFCEIRYCIARHVGFLVGLGRPAGDATCLPQTVDEVLPLLKVPLVHGESFTPMLSACRLLGRPITAYPLPDSAPDRALIACATHLFLQTPDASRAHAALREVMTPEALEHLNVFLAFIRTAHYWTRLHPELTFEDDVAHLLATHEALAQCILNDPEASTTGLSRRMTAELAALKELRAQNAEVVKAYETLSIDHQLVEQRLRDQQTNLRELVAAVPAAVYSCDANGQIVYYNDRAVELWGREPLPDEPAWSLLSGRIFQPDSQPLSSDYAPIRRVLETGLPVVNQEIMFERPDSSFIDLLVNISVLRDPTGRLTGAVNIFQDISELKRTQRDRESLLRELKRSNDELSQFSHAVSHDLRGPVRTVRTLTELLVRRGVDSKEEASHLANLIEQSTQGMERLIESLLRRAQAGQSELNPQQISVQAVVDAVRLSLTEMITNTGASITCSDLPTVTADPTQLEQLFQNLISNAIKYHRPGIAPRIEIKSDWVKDEWRFSVKDNGEGIAPEHQGTIFQAMKRLHGGDTPGSGLGLAICKTIMARHGGRIWVESEGPGYGATFYFTLAGEVPRMEPVETRGSQEPPDIRKGLLQEAPTS